MFFARVLSHGPKKTLACVTSVSEQRKTNGIFGFWPREKWNSFPSSTKCEYLLWTGMKSDPVLIVYNFCCLRLHLETDFVIVLIETYDVPTLYEGDMALTDEQVLALEKNKIRSPNSSQDQEAYTRGAIGNAAYLWPNGIIPFVLSENIGNTYIQRSFYAKKKMPVENK